MIHTLLHVNYFNIPDVVKIYFCTVRERRKVFTVFLNFNDEVPDKPQEEVLVNLRFKYNEPERETEMMKVALCIRIG